MLLDDFESTDVSEPSDSFGSWTDTGRTPTPMDDEDSATSRRGSYECRDRDELYRNRLLREGHVIHLERGGDWSVVMGNEVAAL